ncbi:MAG: helix-turn-helix domain-containing protein [Eggerthellaceae bacterium]|nr:helix-turn-helix domain-containing protein [Eggerthellaceae bacterium]
MDVLLTLPEAAKIMRVSRSKAQKMAKAGALPFRKLGATWVIPRSVLYRELGLELPREEKEAAIA